MNKHYYGNGKPVNVFRNQVKLAGYHTETKSGESVTFADNYNDTADVELTGNQDGLNDVSGNLLSNGAIVSALPTLRKVGAVRDSHVMRTGVKTKRISDWIILNGGKFSGAGSASGLNGNRNIYTPAIYPSIDNNSQGYKYTSEPLGKSITAENSCLANSADSKIYITANMYDTGWNNSYSPSIAEIDAYANGWKMCDSLSSPIPYYKSEVPYTPSTWTEWTNRAGQQTLTKDATGLTITTAYVTDWGKVGIPTSMKTSTKYAVLYNLVGINLTPPLVLGGEVGVYQLMSKTVGNNKLIFTSNATFSLNAFTFQYGYSNSKVGEYVKINDIRIFELPTGSQIESDFTNLTADQLAAKYTFNGLCVKNWKHVTDGLGQTAVLPTASYAGYTPYKMLYQLATPVEEQYDPVDVPTYYPSTIIETDSLVKPTITAIAKVPD